MKILFITYRFYPYVGGIEVNSEILASEFQKKGHQVILVTSTPNESTNKKEWPFTVIRKPSFFKKIQLFFWADVVFENNPTLSISWILLFLPKMHVVAIRTWVSRLDGTIKWQDKLKLWWLNKANATIAISESVRKQACSKATVIGNPYRSQLFKVNPEIKRDKTFVLMGRLVSDKGFDIAIRAFNEFIKNNKLFTHLTMTIIGDGDERNNLAGLVEELNMQKYITFKGTLLSDALANCLNEHTFIIVPSRWEEPFGNVALEGMACGCIPIVSNGGGLPDAVGKAGIIFQRGDVHDLFEKMEQLFVNQTIDCDNLRAEALVHLKEHLSEVVASKYLDVIERVCKK